MKAATTSVPAVSSPVTRSKAARAHIAEGTRLFALAGRPTKAQFVKVYGAKGPTMTWGATSQSGCPSGEVSVRTRGEKQRVKPLFTLGQVVATPGALAAIGVSGDDLSTYLARHQSGDRGDIDAHDRKENQLSLEQGLRLMSVYKLSITGVKIWIITEADRSSTCILQPEEY